MRDIAKDSVARAVGEAGPGGRGKGAGAVAFELVLDRYARAPGVAV